MRTYILNPNGKPEGKFSFQRVGSRFNGRCLSWKFNYLNSHSKRQGDTRWLGGGRPASFAVSRAAEAVIAGVVPECNLSRRAASKLNEIRDRLLFVDGTAVPVVDDGAGRIRIWTFAGARANASIGQALPGSRASSDDFCIDVRSGDARSLIDTLSGLNPIAVSQPLSEQMIRDLKFSQCLPAELASSIISSRLLDKNGIEATLARKKVLTRDLA